MGPREHPEWRDVTRLNTEAPKVPFLAQMTKMPLVNLGLTEGQTRSKSSQNNTFQGFWSNLSFRRFLANVTKFDLKLILSGPKNSNFDLVVRMGSN